MWRRGRRRRYELPFQGQHEKLAKKLDKIAAVQAEAAKLREYAQDMRALNAVFGLAMFGPVRELTSAADSEINAFLDSYEAIKPDKPGKEGRAKTALTKAERAMRHLS